MFFLILGKVLYLYLYLEDIEVNANLANYKMNDYLL
jgi:hypothetical protein